MADSLLRTMMDSFSAEGEIPEFWDLEERNICILCKKVLQVPTMTGCGHRFCKKCIDAYIEENDGKPRICPAGLMDCDKVTSSTVFPDIGTFRELQRVSVKCPNNPHGCNDRIPWAKLKEHVPGCVYSMEECINKGFGCPVKTIRKRIQDHISNECKFRTQPCPKCNVFIPESMLEEHLQGDCPDSSMICPFKCGEQSIQRSELEEHKKVCRAKPNNCKYKDAGCTFSGSPDQVARHEAESTSKHLDLSFKTVQQLQAEVAELRKGSSEDLLVKVSFVEKRLDYYDQMLKSTQKNVAKSNEKVAEAVNKNELEDVKQQLRSLQGRISSPTSSASNMTDDVRIQLERNNSLLNVRVQEMDLRLQCVETVSYNGTLIWKIRDYKRRKLEAQQGKTVSLYSQPFYTSRYGYKACARIYLNGDGMGKNTHVSLFFVLLRGDFDALLSWPFRQKVTMTLIDQEGAKKHIVDSFRADPTSNSFKRPTNDMNIASGCPLFAQQSVVESSNFLKDDCIFLKIQVDTSDLKDIGDNKGV